MTDAAKIVQYTGLRPFFDLIPDPEHRTWVALAGRAAYNHMGAIHGGALCLLAAEVGALAAHRTIGRRIEGSFLSISFIRRAEGALDVAAVVDAHRDAVLVSLSIRRDGQPCAEAFVGGTAMAARQEAGSDPVSKGLRHESDDPSEPWVQFRDAMGIRVRPHTKTRMTAEWVPSDRLDTFGSVHWRPLAIAGLLVDAAGTLVNSDESGQLVPRYVTTSLSVSLLMTGSNSVRGVADIDEVGRGKRVRFTRTTLHGADGTVSGQGMAQFTLIARD